MNQIRSISWTEYKQNIIKYCYKTRNFRACGVSHPLFRGQNSNKWKLESTLHRRLKNNKSVTLDEYMRDCAAMRRLLGNYLPNIIPFDEDALSIAITREALTRSLPNYEFMAFLRHHGCHSPLLDWSESPYIAAYFALREEQPDDVKAVRVYAYTPDIGHGRGCTIDEPHILYYGPFAAIHERHANQQSWYTICVRHSNDHKIILCSHEDALKSNDQGLQDKVEVYDINMSDREEALADLQSMGITEYAIYGTLDALIKTVSCKVLEV